MFTFSNIDASKTVLCMVRKGKETFSVAGYNVNGTWNKVGGTVMTNGELFQDADDQGWFMATYPINKDGYSYQMFAKLDELASVPVLLAELKSIADQHSPQHRDAMLEPDSELIDVLKQATNGEAVTFLMKIEYIAKRYTFTHYRIGRGPIHPLHRQVDPPSVALSLRCLGFYAPSAPVHASLDQLRIGGWRNDDIRSDEIKDLFFFSVEIGDMESCSIIAKTDLQTYKAREQGLTGRFSLAV